MEIHLWHVGALSGAAGSYVLCTDRENTGKKNIRDIITLSADDVKVAEEVLQLLKPLKTVTTLLSTENALSVSMTSENQDSTIHGCK